MPNHGISPTHVAHNMGWFKWLNFNCFCLWLLDLLESWSKIMQNEKSKEPPMNRYLPDGEISYLNILILKPLVYKNVQLAIKWRPYGEELTDHKLWYPLLFSEKFRKKFLRIGKSWWCVKNTSFCLKNWFAASCSTGQRGSCCSNQHSKNSTSKFNFYRDTFERSFLLPGLYICG